jgi:hypothetical protein
LSPNGFVGFNGGSAEILNGSPHYIDSLERIAYAVAIKQGLDLSTDRQEEDLVYTNAGVNVVFYPKLMTEKERKARFEMSRYLRKQKSMSDLVKRWATGDNRPENGCFVGFTLNKSGRVCLPLYY